MKKSYTSLIILVLIVIVAVITNPNEDQHRSEVKKILMQAVGESMESDLAHNDNSLETAGKTLGIALGMTFLDGIINNIISTENFVIFSLTKAT